MQPMGPEQKELLLVDFETDAAGQLLTGKLLLPARMEQDAKEIGCGLLLYRGPKVSQEGRTYHDTSFVSSSMRQLCVQ